VFSGSKGGTYDHLKNRIATVHEDEVETEDIVADGGE